MAEGNVYKMKFFENWGFVVYGSDKLFLLTNPRQYKEDCLYDLVPILSEDIKIAKKPLTPGSKCTIEGEVYDLKLIDMKIFATSSAGDGKKFLLKCLGRNEDLENMDYMAIRCPNIDKR